MAFSSRSKVKKCNKTNVVLNGERIKSVPSFKYLGVTLDPTLNYNQHISSTIGCVQHKLSMLGKIKKYLKREVALNIYKSMVLPYLNYGDVIYSKASSNDLDKLHRLQNRCLKLCQGQERRYNTNRLHRETKVPLLRERRRVHTLNYFMYKRKDIRKDLLNNREIRTKAQNIKTI